MSDLLKKTGKKRKAKRKKLTREQRKLIWEKTTENAGMGWKSSATNPLIFEEGSKK